MGVRGSVGPFLGLGVGGGFFGGWGGGSYWPC